MTLLPFNGCGCGRPGLPPARCAPFTGQSEYRYRQGDCVKCLACVLGKGLRRVSGELGLGPGVGVLGYLRMGRGQAPELAFALMVLLLLSLGVA